MILAIASVVVAAALVAHLMARRLLDAEIEDAFARAGAVPPVAVDRAALPPPVRAFAERNTAGRPGLPAEVRFRQRAGMKLKPGAGWTPVAARQATGIGAPAFAWDARAAFAPLVGVRVIDAHVGGAGWLKARLFGSIPVATASGPDAALGELYRYLAELPWAPHAILGNPSLAWRAIDGRTAEVSAAAEDGRVARVRLVFDADGDVVAVAAEARPRQEGGRQATAPWHGAFADYRDFGGIRVPSRAEVSWATPDGPFAYFRCEIVAYEAGAAR